MPETPSAAAGVSRTQGPDDPRTPTAPLTETIDGVQIQDTPTVRVHHPTDLLNVVLSALGIVVVMILATYAQNTTTGVAEDVQGFATVLRRILFLPVAVLEGLVTIVVPVAVLTELALRRLGRQLLEALVAGIAALVLCTGVEWALETFGSKALISGMSVRLGDTWTLTVPGYVALLVGLLCASGPRTRRRSVSWSWNLLWIAIGVVLITGQVSLPGLAVALLVGRIGGLGVRYLTGVQSERAYGASLIAGIRRAGFDPARLVRVPGGDADADAADHGLFGRRRPAPPEPTANPDIDATARALNRTSDARVYEMRTTDHQRLDVIVLDGDRQVIGTLSRLWRSLRLRGIDGRSVVSLRQAAERTALVSYAARSAGVRTPQLLRIAEAEDSMLLVKEHPGAAVPLADLGPESISDAMLQAIWQQLRIAHEAGLAHRALTSDTVLVDSLLGQPVVWLVGWATGDVASSELARRLDVMQMVALLALRVGAQRAMASAVAVLADDDIAAAGPLLQTVALPRQTREEMRQHPEVLTELRSALVQRLPEADVEPEQLVRFGARTVLSIVVTVAAIVVVLATINVDQITHAISDSDWRWSVVGFLFGMSTLFGGALAFVAYSPVKLSVWRATLTQTAATFVALAAPAGLGPAALNLRMLTRRGVTTSLAVATVALVQVSQFVVTILILVILSIASGSNQATRFTVGPETLIVIGVLAAAIAALLLVPQVRQWVLRKTLPTLRQTWPRLIEVIGEPKRLTLAIAGNVLMTMGYVLAFEACLLAFGQHLSIVQVALIYLAGNTAGALVPTPGGIGTVEASLIFLLSTAVNPGVAASVALLFRAVTYWLRIPFGWAAMRYLQRTNEL